MEAGDEPVGLEGTCRNQVEGIWTAGQDLTFGDLALSKCMGAQCQVVSQGPGNRGG